MAFKPTKGRQVFTQPTGMPNLSGFKEAARAYTELGQMAFNIGTDIMKSEYNDAIRQAEIDGKTAGVTYDKDNNLVPLTNLNYGKEISLFAKKDQEAVARKYRQSAITSYVSAASNDIRISAEQSLSANPNDPDKIRANLDGYLQELKTLEPEIYSSLAPKAVAEYTIAENKALAQQQKEAKEYNVSQNVSAFKANAVKLGVHTAKGPVDEDYLPAEGQELLIQEILEEQDQIKQSLEADGVSKEQILQLENTQNTVVMSRTFQAAVERSFEINGTAATYELIADLKMKAAQSEGIDSSAVDSLLNTTMTGLVAISTAQEKEQKDFLTNIYHGLYRDIILNKFNIRDAVNNPEHPFHELDGTRQGTLFTLGVSSTKQISSDLETANTAVYNNALADLQNPEVSGFDNIQRSMRLINSLVDENALGADSYKLGVEARAEYAKAEKYFLTQGGMKQGSFIQSELGPMSSFTHPPRYYANETYIAGLEATGVIGKDAYFPTRKEFINLVEAYDKLYETRFDNLKLAKLGTDKALNNIMPTSAEMAAMVEANGFDKVIVNGALVDFNLLSDDEAVYTASVDAVAAFAVETDGLLHPDAEVILKNAKNTPENANRALQIMGQAMSAIRSKNEGEREEFVEARFYRNLDMDTVQFLRAVDRVGIENSMKAYSVAPNMNRNASGIVANEKYGGQDFDTIFQDAFTEAVKGKGFLKFFQPNITPEDNQMLYQMAGEAGARNIEDAIIADPVIERTIKEMFNNTMMKHPMAVPTEVVRDVLGQIGKRVGFQKNPDTGELELRKDPILRVAQATTGNTGITLKLEDIDNDIKDKIFANPELFKEIPRLREELANVGKDMVAGGRPGPTLHYLANETYGGEPTYAVVLKDSYGKVHELFPAYSFNFKNTKAFGDGDSQSAYNQALSSLTSERSKRVWSAIGVMDQTMINSVFRQVERRRNDRSLNGLIGIYNQTFGGYKMNYLDDAPLTETEVNEFMDMIDLWRQLGW